MNLNLTEQQLYAYVAVLALLLILAGAIAWWRRRPRDPAELERRRRARVNQIGRIVEGYILEIVDLPPEPAPPRRGFLLFRRNGSHVAAKADPRRLVHYSYSISGVSYEAAQDLTDLEERACLEKVVNGQHVSVKYDPVNPGNSILVADNWSGLH